MCIDPSRQVPDRAAGDLHKDGFLYIPGASASQAGGPVKPDIDLTFPVRASRAAYSSRTPACLSDEAHSRRSRRLEATHCVRPSVRRGRSVDIGMTAVN